MNTPDLSKLDVEDRRLIYIYLGFACMVILLLILLSFYFGYSIGYEHGYTCGRYDLVADFIEFFGGQPDDRPTYCHTR